MMPAYADPCFVICRSRAQVAVSLFLRISRNLTIASLLANTRRHCHDTIALCAAQLLLPYGGSSFSLS
jgi:hypothetical protein